LTLLFWTDALSTFCCSLPFSRCCAKSGDMGNCSHRLRNFTGGLCTGGLNHCCQETLLHHLVKSQSCGKK
jgi:hypothetical protein